MVSARRLVVVAWILGGLLAVTWVTASDAQYATAYTVAAWTEFAQTVPPVETEYTGSIQIIPATDVYAELGGEIVIDLVFDERKGIRFPAQLEGTSWSSDFEMDSSTGTLHVVGTGSLTREIVSGDWSVTIRTASESKLSMRGRFAGNVTR